MDIAKISTALSQIDTTSKVSVAILDKSLETSKNSGQNIVNMINTASMERSINPDIGSNIDIFV